MNVAVLGCGPTGLMAADRLEMLGHYVHIFSKKDPSKISGAQFLHKHMGWYTTPQPDFRILIQKFGTRAGYALRVYGEPNHPVSWDDFEGGDMIAAWDLKKAYQDLWSVWEEHIRDTDITPSVVENLVAGARPYDLVFSSIPAPAICFQNHSFKSQKVFVLTGKVEDPHVAHMDYNGDPLKGDGWYRRCHISGGITSWEYSPDNWSNPPLLDGWTTAAVTKPLSTDCNCHPSVVRIGRYGKWTKGVLTHHVHEEVDNALLEMR